MEGQYSYTKADENQSVNNILTDCKPQPAAAVDHLQLQPSSPPAHLQDENPIHNIPSIINISIQPNSTTASNHGGRWPHNVTTTSPYIFSSTSTDHDIEKFPIDSRAVVFSGDGNGGVRESFPSDEEDPENTMSSYGSSSIHISSCSRSSAIPHDGENTRREFSFFRAQYLQTKPTCEFVPAADHEVQQVETIVELPITTSTTTEPTSSSLEVEDIESSGWRTPRRRSRRSFIMNLPPIRDESADEVESDIDDAYAPFKTKFMNIKSPRIFNLHDSRSFKNNSNVNNNNNVADDGEDAGQQQEQELDAEDYFEALEGPELEVLRPNQIFLGGGIGGGIEKKGGVIGGSVRLDLPCSDKAPLWPFLLRFPIGCFGVCLGLGSQAILWKTVAEATSLHRFHLHLAAGAINMGLWCLSLLALLLVSATYSLKCIFYANAVRREFCHPVRVNFFFAPWLAVMFLALSVPPSISKTSDNHLHPSLAFLFMAPLFALQLKLYGQWLSGGEKRLSRVANPCTHLSLVGNFVGSILATSSGIPELAIFFWSVGIAHYLVLFVTLYQRLPSATSLPKELHPVFFLFIAVPSNASIAWSRMVHDFDLVAKTLYFVALFLFASLVVRVNLFRGLRFSIAWWAYTTPMTALSIATIQYSLKVTHPITEGMALVLSLISAVTVVSLWVITMLHAFFWRTLFPNDVAIAISVNNVVNKERRKI